MPNNIHPSIIENLGKPVDEDLREEVRDLVSLIRGRMVTIMPFYSHLMCKMDPIITRDVVLAGVTRDRKLLINPDWAKTTCEKEFAATLVHETLHAAMLFWSRQAGRNVMAVGPDEVPVSLWNLAHDYAINLIIEESKSPSLLSPAKWSPPGLIDRKYASMSAEEIYDDLLASLPSKASRKVMPGIDKSKADTLPGDRQGPPNSSGEGKAGAKLSKVEQAAHDEFWKVAIVEAAQIHEASKSRGHLPGALKKFIDEILDPRVPWVDVLSRWVGENGRRSDFTYRRPSRRSDSVGEILPSLQRHGVDDITVLWDTSGSMHGREKEIISEVLGICEDLSLTLRVICCDTRVCGDFHDVKDPGDLHFVGGGGSNFVPAFDLLDEEGYTGVVVAFTDGIIGVPKQKPVHLRDCLWVIWNGDVDPTHGSWGEVLNIDKEGFAR